MEWLLDYWQSLTWNGILLGTGIFLLSFALSFLAIGIVMIKIPANYFSSHYRQDFMPNAPWLVRLGLVIVKNVFGVLLILLGMLLSLPGIPGQGILTILLGLVMLDVPGKRTLEGKIIKHFRVLPTINRLRKRYNKTPLIID